MKSKFAARALAGWVQGWVRNTIRHPKWRWWLILGSLIYLLDPFDLLPDMIPFVGWLDDGMIATVLVTEVAQMLNDRRKTQKTQLADQQDTATNLASSSDAISA